MMFEQEFKETFSQVKASDELRMEVLNMKKRTENRISRVPKLALIAGMVLLLTACAVGFDALDMLEAAFGANGQENVEQEKVVAYTDEYGYDIYMSLPAMERVTLDKELAEELLVPYVVPVNQSVTNENDGTVLTVESYLVDFATNTGVVYLSLENPDGFPDYSMSNNGMILWERQRMDEHYLSSVPWGMFYCDEQRTTDTKIYLTLRCIIGLGSTEMKFYFKETEYELVFPIADSGIRNISMDSGNIVVSPMGLYLGNIAKMPAEMMITYLDGSEFLIYGNKTVDMFGRKVNYANYYFALASTGEVKQCSYCINRIVDIDNVKSITIDGEEYFPD